MIKTHEELDAKRIDLIPPHVLASIEKIRDARAESRLAGAILFYTNRVFQSLSDYADAGDVTKPMVVGMQTMLAWLGHDVDESREGVIEALDNLRALPPAEAAQLREKLKTLWSKRPNRKVYGIVLCRHLMQPETQDLLRTLAAVLDGEIDFNEEVPGPDPVSQLSDEDREAVLAARQKRAADEKAAQDKAADAKAEADEAAARTAAAEAKAKAAKDKAEADAKDAADRAKKK